MQILFITPVLKVSRRTVYIREGPGNGASLSIWRLCRGTWKEGTYNEESKRHVIQGFRNRAFAFIGVPQTGTYRQLVGKGMANMFIGPEPVLEIFSCYV